MREANEKNISIITPSHTSLRSSPRPYATGEGKDKETVKTMKEACGDGFQPKRLLVVGGGSHNQLWRQMLADVLDMELHFPKEKESAALGAAFQVGAAVEASRGTLNEGLTMEKYISMQTHKNKMWDV